MRQGSRGLIEDLDKFGQRPSLPARAPTQNAQDNGQREGGDREYECDDPGLQDDGKPERNEAKRKPLGIVIRLELEAP